jgi:hypothetical protein
MRKIVFHGRKRECTVNANGLDAKTKNLLFRHWRRIAFPVDVVGRPRSPPYGYSPLAHRNCSTPSNNKRWRKDPSSTGRRRRAKWAWLHQVGPSRRIHSEAYEQESWRTGQEISQPKRAEFRGICKHGSSALDRAPSVASFDVGGTRSPGGYTH